MKNKTMKKVLASFIAVVMVATSIPFTGIIAYADDASLSVLSTAITAYETKMSDATENKIVYTNQSAAYDAYNKAIRYKDACDYGTQDGSTAASLASTLTSATNAMTSYTEKSISTIDVTNGSSLIAYQALSHLSGWSDTTYEMGSGTYTGSGTQQGNVLLGDYVWLYDGSTTNLQAPVGFYIYVKSPGSGLSTKTRSIKTIKMTTNNSNCTMGTTVVSSGTSYTTSGSAFSEFSKSNGKSGNEYVYSTIKYSGTPSSVLTNINDVGFIFNNQDEGDTSGKVWNIATVLPTGTTADSGVSTTNSNQGYGYILNTVPYKNSITTAKSAGFNQYISGYTASSVKSMFTALDSATSTDIAYAGPTSGSTDHNAINTAVSNTANQLTSVANNFNTAASASGLSSIADYSNIKTALGNSKARYNLGNADGLYTADSWSAFTTAYEAATPYMDALVANDYVTDGTEINAAATTLQNAYDNLETSVSLADTKNLVANINIVKALTTSYYTTATMDAVNAEYTSALACFTNNDSTLPTIYEDKDQAIIDAHTNSLATAILGLRISADAKVIINGSSYSYNSIVAFVNTLNASDYANFTTLVDAKSKATTELTTLEATQFTNQADIISQYTAMIKGIITAYQGLELSFTKIANGTEIKAPTNTVYGATSTSSNEGSFAGTDKDSNKRATIGMEIPTGGIYFRTTHEASTIKSGNFVLKWGTTDSNTYSILFATMNGPSTLSDGSTAIASDEIFSGGRDEANYSKLSALDSAYLQSSSSADVTGGAYNVSSLYCIDSNTSGGFATDASGNEITDKSANLVDYLFGPYTNVGDSVNQNTIRSNKGGSTYSGQYNLDLDATTAGTLSATTLPTSTTYSADKNFGATYVGTCTPTIWTFNTFGYATQAYSTSNTVIDISYLLDLIKECEKITDSSKYSSTTWNTFSNALTNAKAQMSYGTMSTTQILTACKNRYTTLWNAYNGLMEIANFADLNVAYQNFLNKISVGDYSLSSLTAVKNATDALTYYAYTTTQQEATGSENQSAIDAETTALNNAVSTLATVDSSAYDAIIKVVDSLNADDYKTSAIDAIVSAQKISSTCKVLGKSYTGYAYDDAVTAIQTALNDDANRYNYYVKLDGKYLAQDGTFFEVDESAGDTLDLHPETAYYHYGDSVTVTNPDGEADDTFVTVTAATTNVTSTKKYVGNILDYTFYVRGNTAIETYYGTVYPAGNSRSCRKVTFIDGLTYNTFNTEFLTRNKDTSLADYVAPKHAFYDFVGYKVMGESNYVTSINFADDITVIAVYQVSATIADYTINFTNTSNATTSYTRNFNKLVTISDANAVAFVDEDTDKVLAYGNEYSFYACEDINIKAVTTVDTVPQVYVAKNPVVSNNRFYMIGTYALPADCTLVGYGMVLDPTAKACAASELSLGKVNGTTVYNFAASKNTVGNQFTIILTDVSGTHTVNYVAYMIYKDADGIQHTVYSDVCQDKTFTA